MVDEQVGSIGGAPCGHEGHTCPACGGCLFFPCGATANGIHPESIHPESSANPFAPEPETVDEPVGDSEDTDDITVSYEQHQQYIADTF